MTAAAAVYTRKGVAIACDSQTQTQGAVRRVRKMWGEESATGWRFTGAGDADVLLCLMADTPALPDEAVSAMHWYRDHVRATASGIGKMRTAEQGVSFVHVDIIAAHPVHGLWLIVDGQCVERWGEQDGVLAIGDPTAVRAAIFAARQPASVDALLNGLDAVGHVSAVVGGPYIGVEAIGAAWGPEVAMLPLLDGPSVWRGWRRYHPSERGINHA